MLKLGTQTNSLVNHVYSKAHDNTPPVSVGSGATILHWTDRTACTIIELTEKRVILQEDIATRTDSHGMSDQQSYSYMPNLKGIKHVFTKRKNGKWVRKGDTMSGTRCILGVRDHYYDYSF